MMLLEQCTQIQSNIVRLEALDLASKEAERDRSRHDEIQPLRIRLEEASGRAKVLREAGVAFSPWPSQPKLIAAFEEYRRSLNDPETAKRNVYGTFKTALTNLADGSSDLVKKTIDALATRKSDIDESTLKQFDSVPSLQEKVAATRQKRTQYLAASAARHRSTGDLLSFLELRAELLSLAEELTHQHLPTEVLEFYRAVHSGKATIPLLTEQIRAWLEANDQLKDLRITLPIG